MLPPQSQLFIADAEKADCVGSRMTIGGAFFGQRCRLSGRPDIPTIRRLLAVCPEPTFTERYASAPILIEEVHKLVLFPKEVRFHYAAPDWD